MKLANLETMLVCPGKIIGPAAARWHAGPSHLRAADARRLFLDWGGGVIEGDTMTLLHAVFTATSRADPILAI